MANLSEMREGLHVSVSQVKTYLRCPRQYQMRYVVGAEPEFVPRNLVLGSAVHEGLAAYYRSVMETSESPEQDVGLAALHASLEAAKKNRVPLEKGGEDLEAVGTGLLRTFYEAVYQEPPVVVGVEVPFAIELHDPVTGEVLEEKLVGALDLVVRESERHVVVEHKSAAKKWSQDQIKHDVQLSAYKLVGGKIGLGDVGLRLQVLTKTKKPAMIVEDTERGDKDIRDFMATVVGVLRAVDAGVFFPIRNGMCGGCAFQRRCASI
ncbi:MAG: PD-(D/E)XK nuclease family protein [Polyangia bacterium]